MFNGSRSTSLGDHGSGSFKNPSVRPVLSQRGKPMRNWHCACVPGILGPPRTVVPLALQQTVESCARSSPLSWSISGYSSSLSATVTWSAVSGPLSGAAPLPTFPPAVLNLLDHPATTEPTVEPTWTVSCEANLLTATLFWSAAKPSPVSPAVSSPAVSSPAVSSPAVSSPAVSSPAVFSSPASPLSSPPTSDAGYFSASPPAYNSPPSPIKMRSFADVVSSSPSCQTDTSEVAAQTSFPIITKPKTEDAETTTEPTPANSTACQTASPVIATSFTQTSTTSRAVPEQLTSHTQTNPAPTTCSVESQSPTPIKPKPKSKGNQTTPKTKSLACQTEVKATVINNEPVSTEAQSMNINQTQQRVSYPTTNYSTCKLCLQKDLTFNDLRRHFFECTGHPTIQRTAESHEHVLSNLTKEAMSHLNLPPNSCLSAIFELTKFTTRDGSVLIPWRDDKEVCGDEPQSYDEAEYDYADEHCYDDDPDDPDEEYNDGDDY